MNYPLKVEEKTLADKWDNRVFGVGTIVATLYISLPDALEVVRKPPC